MQRRTNGVYNDAEAGVKGGGVMTPAPQSHLNDQFFNPMLNCDCEVCKDAREKHDAAIAAQARNATLDALKAWFVKNKCNGCPYGGNLLDKINSLRGKP
jgi:hypothetical protein